MLLFLLFHTLQRCFGPCKMLSNVYENQIIDNLFLLFEFEITVGLGSFLSDSSIYFFNSDLIISFLCYVLDIGTSKVTFQLFCIFFFCILSIMYSRIPSAQLLIFRYISIFNHILLLVYFLMLFVVFLYSLVVPVLRLFSVHFCRFSILNPHCVVLCCICIKMYKLSF